MNLDLIRLVSLPCRGSHCNCVLSPGRLDSQLRATRGVYSWCKQRGQCSSIAVFAFALLTLPASLALLLVVALLILDEVLLQQRLHRWS